MSSRFSALSFITGAVCGAAVGTVAGILLAPRSGVETRAMAADMANDAWDNAVDAYDSSMGQARSAVNNFGPMVDAKTDELRAKVDMARERMDQLRESLADAVNQDTHVTVDVEVESDAPQTSAPSDTVEE